MDNERSRLKESISGKNKKENTTETVNSIPLQPLILKQNPKNIKGTKSLPYDFGAETYDVYSNPKNPFMVGILAAETDKIQLDPIKAQSLFQQLEKESPYSLEYPLNISSHRKRNSHLQHNLYQRMQIVRLKKLEVRENWKLPPLNICPEKN